DLDDSRPAAALQAAGARLFRGAGNLVDLRTVEVGGEQLVARKAVVIANGGTAAIPPIEGLDKVDYWTNRQAAVPRELPARLIVLGGGAVGVELAQGFARLGSKVTIVEAWKAAGLTQTERGWLKVDPATLAARDGIYGAGDITGIGGFTHLAYYHGQVVARRLRGEDARADHTAVPRVTFTDPEVASVGLSEAAARERGLDVVTASTDPGETARGYIHDFHGGMIKLVGDRGRKVLVGPPLVTPRAGEILGELILAVK